MMRYYDIFTKEACEKLIVVLKLDEMDLVNNKNCEIVSITLMNSALDLSLDKISDKYFQVQYEYHLFWLGIFCVNKESHESLKFVFKKTCLPLIMSSHVARKKLYLEGYGSYFLEWHLASGLKTLKCMYKISHGGNGTRGCLYFMLKKQKDKIWKSGILSYPQGLPPNRDQLDPNVDVVLPIPLIRVHMCNLHAIERIVDKMVYLSILFAWNKIPQEESKNSIEEIQHVLSKVGLHGRNVKIEKDIKRSGTRGNLPGKPSMSGVKEHHFLEKKCGHGCLGFYEDLIDVEDDRIGGGCESSIKKKHAWRSFSSLFLLMDKEKFIEGDAIAFQKVVTNFMCNERSLGREPYDTLYGMYINFHPTSTFLCTSLYFTYYYCKLTSFNTCVWYSKIDRTMYVCSINYLHAGHGLRKNMEAWPCGVQEYGEIT
jgi:hypothetical protein